MCIECVMHAAVCKLAKYTIFYPIVAEAHTESTFVCEILVVTSEKWFFVYEICTVRLDRLYFTNTSLLPP